MTSKDSNTASHQEKVLAVAASALKRVLLAVPQSAEPKLVAVPQLAERVLVAVPQSAERVLLAVPQSVEQTLVVVPRSAEEMLVVVVQVVLPVLQHQPQMEDCDGLFCIDRVQAHLHAHVFARTSELPLDDHHYMRAYVCKGSCTEWYIDNTYRSALPRQLLLR